MTTPPPSENRSSVSAVVFGIEEAEIILDQLHHVANRNLMIILLLDIQLTTKYDQLCVWGGFFGNISVYCHDSLSTWTEIIREFSVRFTTFQGILLFVWHRYNLDTAGNSFPFHEPCKFHTFEGQIPPKITMHFHQVWSPKNWVPFHDPCKFHSPPEVLSVSPVAHQFHVSRFSGRLPSALHQHQPSVHLKGSW